MSRKQLSPSSKFGSYCLENDVREIMTLMPTALHTALTDYVKSAGVSQRDFVGGAIARELNRVLPESIDHLTLIPERQRATPSATVNALRDANAQLAAQLAEMQQKLAQLTAQS